MVKLTTCHKLFMCLIISCLTLCATLSLSPACRMELQRAVDDYEYYQPGDFIIGGIFTVHFNMDEYLCDSDEKKMYCKGPLMSNYKYFLDFLFAIKEVNKNPDILSNVTLGYHVYDSCSKANKAVKSVLQILSGPGATVPNYYCSGEDNIAGFIGDLLSITTVPIAQVLNVYGYTQISYGATDPILSDRTMYPYLFRTARSDHVYSSAVLTLLTHFSWSWVGIITSPDISGDRESQTLSSLLKSHGVCVEFIATFFSYISYRDYGDKQVVTNRNKEIISSSSATIILVCGTVSFQIIEVLQLPDNILNTKTFILPPSWFRNIQILENSFLAFNCCLGFLLYMEPSIKYNNSKGKVLNTYNKGDMKRFLKNIHPSNYPDDKLLEDIWMAHFKCLSPNKEKNKIFENCNKEKKLHKCSGEEGITDFLHLLFNIYSPVIYKALMSMVYALDYMVVRKEFYDIRKKKLKYRHKVDI